MLQNVLLSALFRIAIFNSNLFNGVDRVAHLKAIKPFFGAFFELTVARFYPWGTVFGMFHYIVFGPRILALLDAPLLRGPFERHPRRFFVVTLLVNTSFFFAANTGNIIKILNLNPFSLLYHFIALYALSFCVSFHLFVIQYLHYSTVANLRRIKMALYQKLSKTEENDLISQFIQLAIYNRKLYWLVALPSLIHYTATTIYSMVLTYSVVFLDFPLRSLSYPIFSSLYFLYIVSCNQANVRLAEEILQQLQRKETETRWFLHWSRRRPHGLNDALLTVNSTTIRRHEVELYLDYFQMSFINLAIFDRSLLFGTALITLNYLIFIYQT